MIDVFVPEIVFMWAIKKKPTGVQQIQEQVDGVAVRGESTTAPRGVYQALG